MFNRIKKTMKMKTYNKFLLIAMAFIVAISSCTKTNNVLVPTTPVLPGVITTSGDTTCVTANNVTFCYARTSTCFPSNEVYFYAVTATTYPTGTVYKWDFGDGQQTEGDATSHKYEYGNIYTLTLSIVSNNTVVQQITTPIKPYGQHASPVAIFGSSLNNYRDPNYIAFNAQSSVTSGSIVNYFWDWKDGTTSSVATAYTEHRFPEKNKDTAYKVKLTVTSHAGCQASFDDSLIFIPASYNNVAGISYTKTNACAPDSQIFTFVQDSINLPQNVIYEWDFGDGTGTYTGNPIQHHYVYSKTYPIVCKIRVVGTTGVNIKEIFRNTSVYALGDDIEPEAYLSKLIYLNPPTSNYIQFDGWGKVGDGHIITKLMWEFGDGAVDVNNTPYAFHTYIPPYPANRTYQMKLTVTASSGCVGSKIFNVVIP
jgi:large repetitive protein